MAWCKDGKPINYTYVPDNYLNKAAKRIMREKLKADKVSMDSLSIATFFLNGCILACEPDRHLLVIDVDAFNEGKKNARAHRDGDVPIGWIKENRTLRKKEVK